MKIVLIEGPLLDKIEFRESLYNINRTKEELISELIKEAQNNGVKLVLFQSYNEGDIAKYISELESVDGIIINPGAYTHTSIAIRDALSMIKIPFIEFHFSNIFAREEFRHRSYIGDLAAGVISGLGEISYIIAFNALISLLNKK